MDLNNFEISIYMLQILSFSCMAAFINVIKGPQKMHLEGVLEDFKKF